MENKAVVDLLKKAGIAIVDKMQDTLRKNDDVNTGRLSNSLEPEVEYNDGVYSLLIDGESYAKYIESGRKPGKGAPIQVINEWVRTKGFRTSPGVTVESIGFLINRKIREKGIPARPFIKPSVEFILKNLDKELQGLGVASMQKEVDQLIENVKKNAK